MSQPKSKQIGRKPWNFSSFSRLYGGEFFAGFIAADSVASHVFIEPHVTRRSVSSISSNETLLSIKNPHKSTRLGNFRPPSVCGVLVTCSKYPLNERALYPRVTMDLFLLHDNYGKHCRARRK